MTTILGRILLSPSCLLLGQTAASDTGDPVWLAIGFGLGVLALLLFAVEIFIPTAGMVGILCGICAVASIVSFFQYSAAAGGFATILYLVATPFLLVYGVKLWSQSPIGRRLILGGTDTLDGESLEGEDLVAWVTVGKEHLPRTEDLPLISNFGSYFDLVPWNVHPVNGAMDVA